MPAISVMLRRRPGASLLALVATASALIVPLSAAGGSVRAAAPPPDGLGALARDAGVELGVAADAVAIGSDMAYTDLLLSDATMLSTVNDVALGVIQPEPGTVDFSRADAIVDFADAHDLRVRGHVLIGPDDLPAWLTGGQWTAETLAEVLRNHVTAVVGRYADRNPGVVTQWDVVAEAFLPDGTPRPSIWQRVIGDDYLRIAFDAARAADPDAELFYSDFFDDLAIVDDAVENGVALTPGATATRTTCDEVPKCVGVRAAIGALVEAGAPIDGVGFQAHLLSPDPYDFAVFTDWVEPLGLQWAITEFDVPLPLTEVTNPDVLEFQASAYRSALTACLDDPVCDTFVMWGITDRISPTAEETGGVFGGALPRDTDDAPKPAHGAIADVLAERAPPPAPPTSTNATTTVDPAPATTDADEGADGTDSSDTDGNGTITAVVIAIGILAAAAAVIAVLRRRVETTERTDTDDTVE